MSDSTATVYEDKDFVDVVDEQGNALPPIPKRWFGTSLLPPGVVKAGKSDKKSDKKADKADAKDKAVEIPEGAPDDSWTHAQLDAYAAKQDPAVDVSKAGNKDEKIALLTPPPA